MVRTPALDRIKGVELPARLGTDQFFSQVYLVVASAGANGYEINVQCWCPVLQHDGARGDGLSQDLILVLGQGTGKVQIARPEQLRIFAFR